MKWLRSSGGINIAFSFAAFAISSIGGGLFIGRTKATSDWHGVGQSLLAGAAVSFIALLSGILQHLLVTKNIEAIAQLGIRKFRRRGSPGSGWTKQLRSARSLKFFGKDHGKLIKYQYDLLKELLKDGLVDIHFYLLDDQDLYYRENQKELADRHKAAELLYKLKLDIGAGDGHNLHLWQYKNRPAFTYTQLDKTIIFGPYLPNIDNPDTPEFQIEPDADTWMYDVCMAAYKAAVASATELKKPDTAADPDTNIGGKE